MATTTVTIGTLISIITGLAAAGATGVGPFKKINSDKELIDLLDRLLRKSGVKLPDDPVKKRLMRKEAYKKILVERLEKIKAPPKVRERILRQLYSYDDYYTSGEYGEKVPVKRSKTHMKCANCSRSINRREICPAYYKKPETWSEVGKQTWKVLWKIIKTGAGAFGYPPPTGICPVCGYEQEIPPPKYERFEIRPGHGVIDGVHG
jgi:hypothetical protein